MMELNTTNSKTAIDRIKELNIAGLDHLENSYYEGALACFAEAASLAKSQGDLAEEARQLLLIAEVHCANKQLEQALVCYGETLELYRRLGDGRLAAALCNNIGLLLAQLRRYEEALDTFKEAWREFEAYGA